MRLRRQRSRRDASCWNREKNADELGDGRLEIATACVTTEACRNGPSRSNGACQVKQPVLSMKLLYSLVALALAVTSASAQGVADFYKGKTVRIVVGFSAGGGYDHYARVLSRHIGRH